MDFINSILDRVRLASVLAILLAVAGLIELIQDDITFQEFGVGIGAGTVGVAGLGYVRNQAGHGVARVRDAVR